MPLNCSLKLLDYNACLTCKFQHEDECWANLPVSAKLSSILSIEERIALLEDRNQVPEVSIVIMSKQDYQQLQRLLLLLEERLNQHIQRDLLLKKKKRGRYLEE